MSKDRRDSVSGLDIRSFAPADAAGVKRICYRHFRSLSLAATLYFCGEHLQDLLVLLCIMKCFLRWTHLLTAATVFFLYLILRARCEMECYIRRHCLDLNDIPNFYMSDPKGHFWVAENIEKGGELLGVVGMLPYRGQDNIAQMMRLVVCESSRRMRIGSRLLAQLENFASQKGYTEIRLFTNNLNTSHMMFVRIHGFETLQVVRRGLMRGDLIQWRKILNSGKEVDPSTPRPRVISHLID